MIADTSKPFHTSNLTTRLLDATHPSNCDYVKIQFNNTSETLVLWNSASWNSKLTGASIYVYIYSFSDLAAGPLILESLTHTKSCQLLSIGSIHLS